MRSLKTLKFLNCQHLFVFALLAAGCHTDPVGREGARNENSDQNAASTQKESEALAKANREKEEQFKALQEQLKRLEGRISNITAQDTVAGGDFTLPKSALEEDFLWGSSVQIAVTVDPKTSKKDEQKTYVLGNRVASFKRAGQRLQLVSREDLTTESDFLSEKVIGTFEITSEDQTNFELRATEFGKQSAELAGIVSNESSLRSLHFDPTDSVLLLEITLNQGGGNYTNVLESILPRKRVTGGRSGLQILAAEETSSTRPSEIGFNALLSRIGTFPSTVWTAPENPSTGDDLSNITKTEKSFVTRYNIADGKTIDWWVTSNIPETLLPEIKAGVEGWNRYFNLFRADKPVMRFMGKLPESARIGDPRLNIILFDAVAEAPSAYESQALDPLTGYQSHSLIYLPFAWYNISGNRYLQGADDASLDPAQDQAVSKGASRKAATKNLRPLLRCDRPISYQDIPFLVNNRAAGSLDEAGRALVRSTLLHEVGHALGMDHNFKGTLSGDVSKYNESNWVYSTSTMDYNPFAMEDTLFVEPANPNRDVTKGLVQPYDRQFIDIVYNDGKGTIAREEKAFAFCNDADHDDTTNGVDPFCRQYDFFAAPQQTLAVPLQRLQSAELYLDKSMGRLVTLTGFLSLEQDAILKELSEPGADSEQAKSDAAQAPVNAPVPPLQVERAIAALSEFSAAATKGFNHFLRSGSYSVVNALTRDARLLGEWKPFDGIERDTELSYRSGLQYVAQYIAGLFAEDGLASGEAYSKFERANQSSIAKQMAGVFQTQLAVGENAEFESSAAQFANQSNEALAFAQTANAVLRMQSNFAQVLKSKMAEANKAQTKAFDDAVRNQAAALKSDLQGALTKASVRIIAELGSITVSGSFNAQIVSDRPQIRPEFTHALYAPLASIVARSSAAVSDRNSAIEWLAVFDKNSSTFGARLEVTDPQTNKQILASELRASVLKKTIALLEGEKLPLDQKVAQGAYLSASERERNEFLTEALRVLKQSTP